MALVNKTQFQKFLKEIGIKEYREVGNSIIASSSQRSRDGRKAELQAMRKFFKGSKFVDDGRSGYLEYKFSGKTIKVFSKPEKTASGIILKPSFFPGITDTWIPLSSYGEKVKSGIQESSLDENQKQLLMALLNFHISPSPANKTLWKKAYVSFGETIPKSTINNDFGEVLGPFGILNNKLLPINKTSCSVYIPGRSNEPLLDYKIYDSRKKTEYKISAKSGDTTNTLKPGDVIMLIDGSDKMKAKYKSKDQYKVLKLLAENSWKEGPILALDFLKSKGYKEAKWLSKTSYTEPTRQQSENSIVQISKESLDFTNIYIDATNSKIYYVKFILNAQNLPEWQLATVDRKEASRRVVFRSKNFVGRPNGDKLGFQP